MSAPGIVVVDEVVDPPQEVDGLQVLAPAVAVGNPLPRPAGIVQVQHRRDGVDPEPVQVVAVEPGQGVGDEEAAHLVAPVVEDERAPVHVRALPRVGVLVEVRAVELGQGERVPREMRGHPVENDADAALVEVVDKPGEILGRAEAVGRGEEARHLVAPRPVEGVLGKRHHLDVGEPHLGRVVGKLRGRLPVGQGPVALLGLAPPRAQMNLVDRDRAVQLARLPRAGASIQAASFQAKAPASQTMEALPGGASKRVP